MCTSPENVMLLLKPCGHPELFVAWCTGAHSRQEQRRAALWRAFWLGLTVVIHAMWGLYPVACRWLQVRLSFPYPNFLTFKCAKCLKTTRR